jgi:hypothetical protein
MRPTLAQGLYLASWRLQALQEGHQQLKAQVRLDLKGPEPSRHSTLAQTLPRSGRRRPFLLTGQPQVKVIPTQRPKNTSMPDNLQLDDHQPIQPVTVRRHQIDWDDDQFDIVTAQRALGWGRRLSRGCWYLNPRYTVQAPAPSAPFFKKVREVQGSWLSTVRQAIHNRGLRRESRQRDHLERQLAFSGVLFFDGDIIPPNTWNRLADRLIHPFDFKIVATHRHLDLAALKATANFDHLKQLAQSALQAHVVEHPAQAAFVLPHLTLTTLSVFPAFYQRVEHAKKQWHRLLKRTLSEDVFRDDPNVYDPETKALIFDGILYLEKV